MKKFLALILCSVMLFSACSSDEPVSSEIEQPGTENKSPNKRFAVFLPTPGSCNRSSMLLGTFPS